MDHYSNKGLQLAICGPYEPNPALPGSLKFAANAILNGLKAEDSLKERKGLGVQRLDLDALTPTWIIAEE